LWWKLYAGFDEEPTRPFGFSGTACVAKNRNLSPSGNNYFSTVIVLPCISLHITAFLRLFALSDEKYQRNYIKLLGFTEY